MTPRLENHSEYIQLPVFFDQADKKRTVLKFSASGENKQGIPVWNPEALQGYGDKGGAEAGRHRVGDHGTQKEGSPAWRLFFFF